MSEWKECKIGDVCETISYTYRGSSPEVVLINTSDVLEGKVLNHKFSPNKNLPGQFKKTFSKNDILFSEIRPQNKRFAFVNFDPINYVASTKLMVLRCDTTLILPEFFYFLVSDNRLLEKLQLIAETRSGTFPQITFSELASEKFLLPPINEQKKIIAFLKSIDDKIETNRAINARLEELASAIFKSWFIDFEPVAYSEFVEDEYGRRPKGWKIGDIYEIVKIIYGAPYSSEYFNEKEEGLPLIRIRDLKTNQPQIYTKEILQNTEYINPGDIVAGMDAEFIPYMWQGEKGLLNQRCCKIVPNDETISNGFVLNFMKPYLYFIQSYKTGTTVSHLGKSDLDKIKAIIPPKELIIKYSTATKSLFEEICDRSKETTRLASLRDTLLPRLMSGELIPE